ncbi:MAG TPA: DUF4124 domain-containing protein [Steroidobacteraceae bacterium]|jgi:hypothetical protein|nr:DUF4124 domain-containing protein [Steroidobacteraceae bacterium]
MRGLPLLFLLGVCASAWSATVYKWVDDNGVVHYSDQPNPKAEKLQISGAQTYGAQAAAVTSPAAASRGPAAAPAVCVIDSPGAGQVFLDTFSITGHVTLAHAGGDDSQISLRLDGQDISGLVGPDGSFAISQIDRGEHSLSLQVTDARGDVTCQANAVRFSIRQRSASVPGVPTAPGAPAAPKAPGVGVVH